NSLPFSVNVQSYPDRDEIYVSVTTLRSHYATGVGLSYSRLYRQVLAQMVAKPAQSHHMLSASEQAQLSAWRGEIAAYPEGCLHQLVEAQAQANPDAVAVVSAEHPLTYGELNARANRLARYLREQRLVENETLVGICLERSPQLIVAILAVLKAGGAYVPLDPEYPQERLALMQADAGLGTVLTRESLAAEWLPRDSRVELDSVPVQASLAGYAQDNLELAYQPEQLAYVTYTSGSTGTPKGVMVEHRNVVSLVCGVDYVELNADTVTLLHSPASFDAATFEIWAALLNGGVLALHQGSSADVEALAESVAHYDVTTLWLTAGLFDVFSEAILRPLPKLRQLLAGGDIVNRAAVRAVQQRNPQLQCINGYGPTENTTFSTTYSIPQVQEGGALPIGRPLTNRHAYVLDSQQRLVPVGVSGELYVGGAGLARGYLNRAELTAERFIANPFAPKGSAERLYRTGDMVRWREDGQLEYLGRNDYQVKIRGYRIELGEIEQVLQSQEGIAEALVLAQDTVAGKQLVAYYRAEQSVNVDVLRQRLSACLPEYMVPAHWMALEVFPLTANGKVDRKALPVPQVEERGEYEAPQGETEHALAQLWQALLGV
ncbi:amino acid adenylation domain-containing protein, partial [Rheinheimera gaetbuli]